MPRNLDPRLIAFEARLERGAILRLDPQAKRGGANALSGAVLRFQFNPDTITRTRTGKWDPRKKRKDMTIASPQAVRSRSGQGSSALLAESEQISLRVTFDATEAVLAGRIAEAGETPAHGILPELAFLELVSTGKEGIEANKNKNKGREAVQPIRPDELLLILGKVRMFPVVLTNLTITEQKFLPTLVPLRAEVELKFNVLEPAESAYRQWIDVAFKRLLDNRLSAASIAEDREGVVRAIAQELNGAAK